MLLKPKDPLYHLDALTYGYVVEEFRKAKNDDLFRFRSQDTQTITDLMVAERVAVTSEVCNIWCLHM